VYDAVAVERLGKPAVAIGNEGFANDAKSAVSGKGMPGVRFVPEPIPCENTVIEKAEAGIDVVFDQIVAALTRPLTNEEESPKTGETEPPARIVFKGDLMEVNRFYYKRGWTDGLPIIPPTEELVSEMLTGTDLPPDHIVGKMVPRMGKVTVEKIAINAVMAGAMPTYMPLLIAAAEALVDPWTMFGTYQVSTGSWSPFWLINGPIRNQLKINSSSGALSPGNIANATIGRAMSLIAKNVGGARPGIEDMGVLGNPCKYSMVAAETEEESPWEPFHVQEGFDREDNCISVSFPNSYSQLWPYGSDEKGIMEALIYNITPGRGLATLVLPPVHAKTLAAGGWTKKEILAYIAEYARVPAYRTAMQTRPEAQTFKGQGVGGATWTHPTDNRPVGQMVRRPALNPEDPVAVLRDPVTARIIVFGGPGAFMGIFSTPARWITKKVELPKEWEGLLRKYRDVVPTYARY
jgi:hypothetical protein